MLSFFGKRLYARNLRHRLFHSRDIDDKIILPSDWTRLTFECQINGDGGLLIVLGGWKISENLISGGLLINGGRGGGGGGGERILLTWPK